MDYAKKGLYPSPILNGFIKTLNNTIEAANGGGFFSLSLYLFPTDAINPAAPHHCCLAKFPQFPSLLSLDLLQFETVFQLHFMFGEVPCKPGPTHWIDIGIPHDRIKVPNNNGEGSQNRLIKMDRPSNIPSTHGKKLQPFCLKPKN